MPLLYHLNEELNRAEWSGVIENLPAILDGLPASHLIQSRRNDVYWLEHAGRKVAAKRFFNDGIWKKVAYRIRSSKARRSYEHSAALIRAGLRTPVPIAWREDRKGPWLRESFYLCEFVSIVDDGRPLVSLSEADRLSRLRLMGRTIARMHEAGMLHLDLTSNNLVSVEDAGPDPQLYIIDNNRMRMGPVELDRGVRSMLRTGIDGENLRPFVEAYADERGFDPELCLGRYRHQKSRYDLKWRIKNATRPWRRKVGL